MIRPLKICLLAWSMALPLTTFAVTNTVLIIENTTAIKALGKMRKLVSAQNYQELGFQTVTEVQQASLGTEIQMRVVPLDKLRTYQPTVDPMTLLRPCVSVLYPVLSVTNTSALVVTNTRSAITFGKFAQGWKIVSYGMPHLSRLWTASRQHAMQVKELPEHEFFGVCIPALNVNFLAYHHPQTHELMLGSIVNDPSLGLIQNQFLPANQHLAALVPAAQHHNGLPN